MSELSTIVLAVLTVLGGLAVLAACVVGAARRADRDRAADRDHVGRHRRDLDALARVHERTTAERGRQ
jgi:hypothetical protein